MLLLTRTPGTAIQIGDDITILVKRIRGNQVQIGIDAPKDVRVDRSEIRERKDGNLSGLARIGEYTIVGRSLYLDGKFIGVADSVQAQQGFHHPETQEWMALPKNVDRLIEEYAE